MKSRGPRRAGEVQHHDDFDNVNILGVLLGHGLMAFLGKNELAAMRLSCAEARDFSYAFIKQAVVCLPGTDPVSMGRFLSRLGPKDWTLTIKCVAQEDVTQSSIQTRSARKRIEQYEEAQQAAEQYIISVVQAAGPTGISARRLHVCLLVPGAMVDKGIKAMCQGDDGPDLATPAAAIRQLLCAPGLRLSAFSIGTYCSTRSLCLLRIAPQHAMQLLAALVQHHSATLYMLGASCLHADPLLLMRLHGLPHLRVLHTTWHKRQCLWELAGGSLAERLEVLTMDLSTLGLHDEEEELPAMRSVHTICFESQCSGGKFSKVVESGLGGQQAAVDIPAPARHRLTAPRHLRHFPALRALHGCTFWVPLSADLRACSDQTRRDLADAAAILKQLRGTWGVATHLDAKTWPALPALPPGTLQYVQDARVKVSGAHEGRGQVIDSQGGAAGPPGAAWRHAAQAVLQAFLGSMHSLQELNIVVQHTSDTLGYLQLLLTEGAVRALAPGLRLLRLSRCSVSADAAAADAADEQRELRLLRQLAQWGPASLARIVLSGVFSAGACGDIRTADGRVVQVVGCP